MGGGGQSVRARVGGSRRQEEVVETEGGSTGAELGEWAGDRRGEQAAEGRVAGDGRGGGACKTEA